MELEGPGHGKEEKADQKEKLAATEAKVEKAKIEKVIAKEKLKEAAKQKVAAEDKVAKLEAKVEHAEAKKEKVKE